MTELGNYQLGDGIRYKIELKNIRDNYQDATNINMDIVDFNDKSIITNKNLSHDDTGIYSQDINISNNSFNEGGYFVIVHGDIEGFLFYKEAFFYINKNRLV